ncbi:hypothetical protein BE20_0069 [Staphylococcus phage vB_SepS_BE20]|nr:hypothetical protein BE20_0069 [Staphylococcus phage vB_SepS_BE20]
MQRLIKDDKHLSNHFDIEYLTIVRKDKHYVL